MGQPDLPASPIFDRLTLSQRETLRRLVETEVYAAGDTIVVEGKRTDGLWVLTGGTCEVVKSASGGGRHVLAELGPGAVFGEMSFFAPAAPVASVRCLTPASAVKLTAETFTHLERTAPDVASKVTRAIVIVLSERLRRMDEWASSLLAQASHAKREEWADFRARLYNNWEF